MANYRSIHVKFWADPEFEDFSADARFVFIYLITNAHRNESALYSISPKRMASETGLSVKKVLGALDELNKSSKIMYDPNHSVVWVKNAVKYQSLNDNCIKSIVTDLERCPSKALVSAFAIFYKDFKDLGTHLDGFTNPPIELGIGLGVGIGKEDKIEKKEKPKPHQRKPESVDEVKDYCLSIGLTFEDANDFFDYYTANGWVQGKQGKPIVDWKAGARNWKRNKEKYNGNTNQRTYKKSEQIARATFVHDDGAKQRLRELEETLNQRDAERARNKRP